MKIYRIITILIFAFISIQFGYAIENKVVILNLRKGYPVKGVIVSQTPKSIIIKSTDGDVFEYKTDEITSIVDAQAAVSSSSSKSLFSEIKPITNINAKGNMILSLGIGNTGEIRTNNETMILPFIPISLEYIIKDDLLDNKCALGIGGLAEYYGTKYEDWTTTLLLISARSYVHYSVIKKLDSYAGISLGYGYAKVGTSNFSVSGKGYMALDYFVGCRYYFSKKLAGMAELGSGISWLTLGLSIKI